MTKILLTGITGYIGGAIMTRFAQRPDFNSFDIRCIVRSAEKGKKIEALFKNVTVIVGSHSDISLMSKAAAEVDVVIAAANCNDLDAVTGTLQGMKKRFEETGKKPIFINTSGVGVVADDAAGMYEGETIWDDANPEQMATLQPTQPHRPVDLKIVAADEEGYVNTYIVLPCTVWNFAKGPLFDSGISNKGSATFPYLIRASLDRGHGSMIGLGKNVWHNIEIHELAELYNILFDAVRSPDGGPGHGREGYYFGANEEHRWYQIGKGISDVLQKMNRVKGVEPTTFSKEELDKYFDPKYFHGKVYLGSNCRCRPNRSKALGWTPKMTTKDMLNNIYAEAALVIDASAKSDKL